MTLPQTILMSSEFGTVPFSKLFKERMGLRHLRSIYCCCIVTKKGREFNGRNLFRKVPRGLRKASSACRLRELFLSRLL